MTSYNYQFTSRAFKQLQKLSKSVQIRIVNKMDYFCSKNPLDFAEKLSNPKIGTYRFRIGDYRVVADIEKKDSVTVVLVGHRKEIYR